MSLRIAVNTSCAVAGGAITHLRHLLPELQQVANDVDLIVVGDATARRKIDPPKGIRWIETPLLGGGLWSRLRFENVTLPQLLVQNGVDVLFHPSNFAVFRSPVPQVILIHNLAPFLPEVVRNESFSQKLRLRLLRYLTQWSLVVADRTIFISRWGRNQVLGTGKADESRMPVIAFGSEHGSVGASSDVLDRWELESDRFVLTVSHLYRYKKLENLIEAHRLLGDRYPDWPLVVVGEPFDLAYSEDMKKRAAASRARVVFTGGLDGPTLARLMADCRVFVFTSEAENLPITLLEAMAAGCAIVTNRACSMPEVCLNACEYADPPSPENYAVAIDELHRDEARRQSLRRAAKVRAADFSWKRAARETLALLRVARSEAT